MTKEPTADQFQLAFSLKEGERVLLTNGDIAEFIKAKTKKFSGIVDGKRFAIPMSMLVEIVKAGANEEALKKVQVSKIISNEPTTEQFDAIDSVNKGDRVLLKNGEIVEFVKAMQKKFVVIKDDGSSWNFLISNFVKVVEKVDTNKKETEKRTLINNLKKGDLFYIVKNNDAIIYRFEEIKGKNIIGISPVRNTTFRIDMSFEIGILK